MILAVDIGNTTIGIAGMRGRRPVWIDSVLTATSSRTRMAFFSGLRNRYLMKTRLSGVIICSVVPDCTEKVARELGKIFQVNPTIIGTDIQVPLKNRYLHPRQVGQDRLVGAYAAKMLYGSPVIVIDLGTAITFDVVSKAGDYEGGMIIPGIKMSMESLYARTALLPSVKRIKIPETLIGKTTEESILSGIFYGYGSLCSGLIARIQREVKGSPSVIVTGGHAKLLKKFISHQVTKIHPQLVFVGLAILAEDISG